MSPIAISPASYYHCDVIVIMTSRAYGVRSPRSHYDVIIIVTSFATELAAHRYRRTNVRTDGHLTSFNI